MYQVEVTCKFVTKTEEQAKYIEKFFDDAQGLVSCENSSFATTGVSEVGALPEFTLHDVVIEKEEDAALVLDNLSGIKSVFGFASVEDYYNFVGVEATFADARWGWRTLEGVDVRETRGGWRLNLPQPEPIRPH